MLRSCFRLMAATLVVVGLLLVVRPASAVVTYDYVGTPFTSVVPPYTTSMFVTATLTLRRPDPLPNGLSLTNITGLPGFQPDDLRSGTHTVHDRFARSCTISSHDGRGLNRRVDRQQSDRQ